MIGTMLARRTSILLIAAALAALAQKGPEAGKGFRPFKFGEVDGFILNDGVWEKPHDPAFIKNVSVEETKAALAAAGIANEVVPIPFNVTLVNFGNETVLFDAGTGVKGARLTGMHLRMPGAGADGHTSGDGNAGA